jgi:hypothetical protein
MIMVAIKFCVQRQEAISRTAEMSVLSVRVSPVSCNYFVAYSVT